MAAPLSNYWFAKAVRCRRAMKMLHTLGKANMCIHSNSCDGDKYVRQGADRGGSLSLVILHNLRGAAACRTRMSWPASKDAMGNGSLVPLLALAGDGITEPEMPIRDEQTSEGRRVDGERLITMFSRIWGSDCGPAPRTTRSSSLSSFLLVNEGKGLLLILCTIALQ